MAAKQDSISGKELILLPALKNCRVAGNPRYLENRICGANIMEVPDIVKWAQAGDMMITTAYPFRDDLPGFVRLIRQMSAIGIPALAIKPRRFIREITPDMVRQADECGMLLIELAPDAVFSRIIFETVQAISYKGLWEYTETQSRISRLLPKLSGLNSETELFASVASELNANVLLLDPENRISVVKQIDNQKPAIIPDGRTLSRFIRPGRSVEIPGTNVLKYYCVCFSADSAPQWTLLLDTRTQPVSHQDRLLISNLTPIIELQLSNLTWNRQKAFEYRDSFIRELLHGDVTDFHDIIHYSSELKLHFSTDESYCACIVNRSGLYSSSPENRYRIRKFLSVFAASVDNGRIVLIMKADEIDPPKRATLQILQEHLGTDFQLAVSRRCSLDRISEGYRESQKIVETAGNCHLSGRVIRKQDLGTYALIDGIPKDLYAEFLQDTLSPLIRSDSKGVLLPTLQSYIEQNWNAKETAKKLDIHYNTINYRLEKIQEVLNVDLSNAEDRLKIQLAMKMYSMEV